MGIITKEICDRCENEIEGTLYRFYLYAEDVKGGLTCEAACQNISTNMGCGKTYCSKCVNDLRKEFKF